MTVDTKIGERDTVDGRDEKGERFKKRTSPRRQEICKRNIRRISREFESTLEIDPEHRTAHINMSQDPYHAVISGREFPQPLTDFDNDEWDWLCQRVLTIHEGAHGRWTDFDDFEKRLDELPTDIQGTAKEIWNAAEDGAIEECLRNEYPGVAAAILVFRANLFHRESNENDEVLSVAGATISAVLDTHTYDSGKKDDIINGEYSFQSQEDRNIFEEKIVPKVEKLADSVLSEPNPQDRNEIIFDFIEEIQDFLEEADNGGKQGQGSESGEESSGGMPNDAENSEGNGETEDADGLDGSSSEVPSESDVDEAAEQAKQSAKDSLQREESIPPQDTESPTEKVIQDSGVENTNIYEGDRHLSPDTWKEIKQNGRRLESILDDLVSSKSTRRKRGQRRGRLDSASLYRVIFGDKHIKVNRNNPDSPDQSFIIVLDRSGSMKSDVTEAEIATGSLALALSKIGVDVMVLDLLDDEITVACPLEKNPTECKSALANGERGGGTPLSDCLEFAKESGTRLSGDTNIIVVTDDGPDNKNRYKDVLASCPFPVIGVIISRNSSRFGSRCYNRSVAANNKSELLGALTQISREIVASDL